MIISRPKLTHDASFVVFFYSKPFGSLLRRDSVHFIKHAKTKERLFEKDPCKEESPVNAMLLYGPLLLYISWSTTVVLYTVLWDAQVVRVIRNPTFDRRRRQHVNFIETRGPEFYKVALCHLINTNGVSFRYVPFLGLGKLFWVCSETMGSFRSRLENRLSCIHETFDDVIDRWRRADCCFDLDDSVSLCPGH